MKEILPLRIVAARFISTNELDGLAELDRITADVYRLIQIKYLIWWIALSAALFASAITLLPGIGFAIIGVKGGEIVATIGLIPFSLLLAVVAYWRILQYGSMRATAPQKAIYANPDDPAARNLERLFALLQLETTPRAFYVTRNGVRRYINERYFFGSLRAAYVAKGSPVRDVLFAPIGFWFSREVFLEADVGALIAQAKAKPNRGAPRTYDYADAVMSLIEHPVIAAMDISRRGSKTQVTDLLEDWYRTKRLPVPSRTQLSLYAKSVVDVIAKNRRAKP